MKRSRVDCVEHGPLLKGWGEVFFKGGKKRQLMTNLRYENTDYCLMVVKKRREGRRDRKGGMYRNKRVNRR